METPDREPFGNVRQGKPPSDTQPEVVVLNRVALDGLDGLVRLRQHAFDGGADIMLAVVHGQHDAHERSHGSTPRARKRFAAPEEAIAKAARSPSALHAGAGNIPPSPSIDAWIPVAAKRDAKF